MRLPLTNDQSGRDVRHSVVVVIGNGSALVRRKSIVGFTTSQRQLGNISTSTNTEPTSQTTFANESPRLSILPPTHTTTTTQFVVPKRRGRNSILQPQPGINLLPSHTLRKAIENIPKRLAESSTKGRLPALGETESDSGSSNNAIEHTRDEPFRGRITLHRSELINERQTNTQAENKRASLEIRSEEMKRLSISISRTQPTDKTRNQVPGISHTEKDKIDEILSELKRNQKKQQKQQKQQQEIPKQHACSASSDKFNRVRRHSFLNKLSYEDACKWAVKLRSIDLTTYCSASFARDIGTFTRLVSKSTHPQLRIEAWRALVVVTHCSAAPTLMDAIVGARMIVTLAMGAFLGDAKLTKIRNVDPLYRWPTDTIRITAAKALSKLCGTFCRQVESTNQTNAKKIEQEEGQSAAWFKALVEQGGLEVLLVYAWTPNLEEISIPATLEGHPPTVNMSSIFDTNINESASITVPALEEIQAVCKTCIRHHISNSKLDKLEVLLGSGGRSNPRIGAMIDFKLLHCPEFASRVRFCILQERISRELQTTAKATNDEKSELNAQKTNTQIIAKRRNEKLLSVRLAKAKKLARVEWSRIDQSNQTKPEITQKMVKKKLGMSTGAPQLLALLDQLKEAPVPYDISLDPVALALKELKSIRMCQEAIEECITHLENVNLCENVISTIVKQYAIPRMREREIERENERLRLLREQTAEELELRRLTLEWKGIKIEDESALSIRRIELDARRREQKNMEINDRASVKRAIKNMSRKKRRAYVLREQEFDRRCAARKCARLEREKQKSTRTESDLQSVVQRESSSTPSNSQYESSGMQSILKNSSIHNDVSYDVIEEENEEEIEIEKEEEGEGNGYDAWDMCRDENGNVFYVHEDTGESRWVHPYDEGTEWDDERYNDIPENEEYAEYEGGGQYVGEAWPGNQEYQYQSAAAGDWLTTDGQAWEQQQNEWDGYTEHY